MHLSRFFFLLSLPLMFVRPVPADAKTTDDAVLVIGALHGLHDREPAFGYDRLRAAIVEFAPDVLVLEVRPDELAERKPTPGRPEYPAVIWPLLAQMRVEAIAMEPGGETFNAITGEAGAAFKELGRRDPEGVAALSRLDTTTEDILLSYWQNPGQIQDATTASLAAGLQAAQFALAGPAFAAAQSRWESYMSEQALHAVRANPGKRVMVIGSYKNRAMLERFVREAAPQRVLSASDWFKRMTPATMTAGAAFLASGTAAQPSKSRYDASAITWEFDAQCAAGTFSGVVVIRARGQTVFDRQCGMADIVNDIANTRETRFKIYSTSKFITALTVMRLVEREKMVLDAPISRYVHDAPPEWAEVTVRHLLNHSSGIQDLTIRLVELFKIDQPHAMRSALGGLKPDERALRNPPGTRFQYNNFGFELLADAAATADGMPFEAVVAKEVFAPAGMTTASIEAPNLVMGHPAAVNEPGLAIGYNGAPGKLEQATNFAFVQLGAGAIRATAQDFVALDTALRAGKILSRASVDEMTRTVLPDDGRDTGRNWGLGVIVREKDGVTMHGHTGGTNGYISDFERFPDDDAMMIALTNRGFVKTRWLADGVAKMLKAAR